MLQDRGAVRGKCRAWPSLICIIVTNFDGVVATSFTRGSRPASKSNSCAQGIIRRGELIYKMSVVLYMCEFEYRQCPLINLPLAPPIAASLDVSLARESARRSSW